MNKYSDLAEQILRNVGGSENVESVTHCVTRLRFKLRDSALADTEKLKNTDGIITALKSGGQYMVVIGNAVTDVYEELLELGCSGSAERGNALATPREVNPFNLFVDVVTGVFSPLLGILSGMGLLQGLLCLVSYGGLLPLRAGTYNILYALADAMFYFFPIVLGYSAAKKFGLPPVEGLILGAALVHPYLIEGSGRDISNLFGVIPVFMPSSGDYSRSLLPIICAVALAAWLEHRLRKCIPEVVRAFMLPLIVLTVSFLATIIVIGPVSALASDLIASFFHLVNKRSPLIMGMLVGGLWQILVMFGLHWALIPVAISNMATMGYDTILVASFCTTFAQTGAVMAIWLKSRDAHTRSLCVPAIISGLSGVTEPAIYGITLPRKVPYLISCIVSGLAGALAVQMGGRCYQIAGMGIFAYTRFIRRGGIRGLWLMLALSMSAMVVTLLLVLLAWREPAPAEAPQPEQEPNAPQRPRADVPDRDPDSFDSIQITLPPEGLLLTSPLAGAILPLRCLPDPIFSAELMGKGFVVRPTGNEVLAPVDAWVRTVAKTGHAVGLVTDDGVEILIHVGIDTVKMEGDGFEPAVHQGQRVCRGQLLLRFDPLKIVKAGYTLMTPVVIANSFNLGEITIQAQESACVEPCTEPVLHVLP